MWPHGGMICAGAMAWVPVRISPSGHINVAGSRMRAECSRDTEWRRPAHMTRERAGRDGVGGGRSATTGHRVVRLGLGGVGGEGG